MHYILFVLPQMAKEKSLLLQSCLSLLLITFSKTKSNETNNHMLCINLFYLLRIQPMTITEMHFYSKYH